MPSNLASVVRLALHLGFTAFGGPAAHIAMLREHAVTRRKWLSEQEFLDLLGLTNLIPGPNSTEMVMHVGYKRAGGIGLVLAGMAFILPAALITLVFAWLYMRYGTTPEGDWILEGIKPVVLAVVLQAIWNLGRTAFKSRLLATIGVIVFGLYLLGWNEILLLFGAALAYAAITRILPRISSIRTFAMPPLLLIPAMLATTAATPYSGGRLLLGFLKIGTFLYGSGYVLVAFLQSEFVDRLGWLTREQLLDAVAVGQFTPGPVFTTATFVGYVIAGFPGAALATIGIFLPAFIFAAIVHPIMPRLMALTWTRPLLDAINVAAIGLMAGVALTLARDALVDMPTLLLGGIALVLLVRFRINSALLILGGALASGAMTAVS